ncbi:MULTISPECIES: recombinase family protein [Gordonia]|uniref:Recombinase family protein n=1 Tax=Gordonia amicalis TaxID=89053 RepID=A0ABU4D7R0_9ACTN|nr:MULTISPECIES: recombinase family protein [Gordonia]MCZ4581920.1 recombinase family protein [Gordonia amicalis]MCZ4651132.1 recombinase family protein [Gordonia amicalis]MDJ0452138.1 recombinase family protein [Gordonia amicalis]MDV6305767.1 recombinase family protein [Gordonia amicalis]MDV7074751.1 recombinase family protein [Gordonia amicalis]
MSKRTAPAATAVAYLRVSTEEQATSGAGLAAQRAAIEAEATRRGLTIVEFFSDEGISGKAIANRPALAEAIAAVEAGQAESLMVAKLDRLSRSVADASRLLDQASRNGWRVLSADLAVDQTTPAGEAAASMMIVFSQLERRLISQRTKDALAQKRAQGVRLGRPSETPAEVTRRIVDAKARGLSLRAIAAELSEAGIATARGGMWRASTVKAVLDSQDAAALAK